MRLRLALLLAGAFLVAAPSSSFAQKKQRDVITNDEIAKSGSKDLDLLSAIKALRPHFMEMPRGARTLGGSAINPIMVVIDGRRGDAEMLTTLKATDAKEVRYLDPNRSQNEYGINANSGAIVVKLMGAKDKEKEKP